MRIIKQTLSDRMFLIFVYIVLGMIAAIYLLIAVLVNMTGADKELAKDTIQKHIRKTQTLVRAYYANKKKKNNKVND